MRNRLRRYLCLVVIVLLSCGLFQSCSGSQKERQQTAALETEKAITNQTYEPEENGNDYICTLSTWGWDENYWNTVTSAFNEKYPNVKFEYIPMANSESVKNYKTALAAGTELPDIPWAIIDSRAMLFELDMWEALDKEPYNFDINLVFDYLHPIMKNSKGDVCGIEQGVTPAGLAYRRDLTLEYFGTDDPEELEKMFPTWDAFIEKGIEVRKKSGGKVFMWPGMGDAVQVLREQDPTPYIIDDTIQMTRVLKRPLELVFKFRDAGIVDKLDAWSPAWYASYGEGKHIFAGCASWTSQFVIQPNDPEGRIKGHWGLMNVPEGSMSWGGTTMGISKTCKNKDIAWEFVKFATLSQEGAEAIKKIGFFTSAKAPYMNDPNFASFKDPWFGGQDTGKFFMEQIVPQIQLRSLNVDDAVIHEVLQLITAVLNADPNMSFEEGFKKLREELEKRLPEYNIE